MIHSVSAIREIHFWFRVQFLLFSQKSSSKFLLKILLLWKPSGFISLNFCPLKPQFNILIGEELNINVCDRKNSIEKYKCPGIPKFPLKLPNWWQNSFKEQGFAQNFQRFVSKIAQGSGFQSLNFSKFFRVLSYSGYSYSGYWVYKNTCSICPCIMQWPMLRLG